MVVEGLVPEMTDNPKEYKTDSLGLCPYLEMNGLRYLRAEPALGKFDKPVVMFVFEDKLGVGKDLELSFMRSSEKRYRDLTFFFRNEIEKLKRLTDHASAAATRRSTNRFNVEE